ncbi:MAG: Sensor histidine kinase RcsC [Desulfovibrio sp.]
MRNGLFKSGGKFFLGVTVFAILVSVSFIGIIAYRQMYEQRHALAAEANVNISSQVSSAMALWLGDQVHMAEVFAAAPEIVEYCMSPLDMEKRAAAAAFLERNHKLSPHFTLINVMYYLQEGEDMFSLTVGGTRRQIGNGYSLVDSIGGKSVGVGGVSFSYIKAVYEGSPAFISEAKPNAIPGLPPLYMVAVPVRDKNGNRLAALGFGVKLDHFNRHFITNFRHGETGRVEIVDNKGFFIGSSDPFKVFTEKHKPEGEAILARCDPHKNKTFSLDLPDGPQDFSASPVWVKYDMASAWWVVFRRSSAELHQELTQARRGLIMVCSLAAAFMTLMAFRSSRAAGREAQERAMRKETELKKVFVDRAPYAVVHVGGNWRILDSNPAASRLFGYREEELLGKSLDVFILPEGKPFSEKASHARSGECTGRNKDGERLIFMYDICELEGGEHLLFFRDETELAAQRRKTVELSENLAASLKESERLRVEAERANNAKSEFLANMSHEIRTPMNAIIGMTHLLLQQNMEEKLRGYAEKIQTAGKSLLGVINSVLDFSKIEAGKMAIETVSLDLSNVLERISSIYQQPFVEKGLSLSITLDPAVPRHLMGDPLRLEQVITNLISNALKFTEKGGVTVTANLLEKNDSSVFLQFGVADTGIGMTAEESGRLFKAFSQADTSTTRKYGGTGLGLVIAKLLVELMDGEVRLESEPGRGSTFIFTARLGIAEASPGEEAEAAYAHEPDMDALSGRRVLLVEDNPINQDVASELLAGVGIAVSIAHNGQEASEILANADHGFELVLMDVQMPIMDGYEATKTARHYAHNRSLPIIAMTAHAMSTERDKCMGAGMDDHLSKPIEVDMLYKTLEKWLRAPEGRP